MGELAVPGRESGRHALVPAHGSFPDMPVIRPSERSSEPYPLVDGISPTIGWQWRTEEEGGPAFTVITRSVMGTRKVRERFPLSADGWARAWSDLVRLSPANAAQAENALRRRAAESTVQDQRRRASAEVPVLEARTLAAIRGAALLGGYASGADMVVGERYDARFLEDRLGIYPARLPDAVLEVPYGDVEAVDIGGPGMVKSGGRFVGGGFGAAGALEGMAVAAVLNALTTRTTITTVARVQAVGAELFLLETAMTPQQLRMHLSRPLGVIRLAQAARPDDRPAPGRASLVDELARLASMLDSGLLTREEFDTLKARLLSQ
jgi:hypothetical protein